TDLARAKGGGVDSAVWLPVALASLVAAIALSLIGAGAFLPRAYVVCRAVSLAVPPDVVWHRITDYAALPRWHPGGTKAERLPDRDGHTVWRESHRGLLGPLVFETVEVRAPCRLVRTLAAEHGPLTGRWEFDLTPTAGGTRLALTGRGEVATPFCRLL